LGCALASSCILFILALREGIAPGLRAVLSVLPVVIWLVATAATAARITLHHLMTLFPAVIFVFFGVPELLERLKRRDGILEGILTTTVVFCIVLGAAVYRPGERVVFSVMLPAVPLVILLIAMERRVIFSYGGMSLMLAFFCGAAFVNGVEAWQNSIVKYKNYNAARIAFLEKHTTKGDAILFRDIGSLEHSGPLYFDRVFLVAKSPDDEERLVRQLRERGISRIYEWTTNPLSVRGFNPYGGDSPPAFPFPAGTKSCCSGSCREKYSYLVRLDTGEIPSNGIGRKGS
jgi:hypothetical protein